MDTRAAVAGIVVVTGFLLVACSTSSTSAPSSTPPSTTSPSSTLAPTSTTPPGVTTSEPTTPSDTTPLPPGVPDLVLVSQDLDRWPEGNVWVVSAGAATAWTDVSGDESGYVSARFGPSGFIYASRVVDDRVRIDRISGPGDAETLLVLPGIPEGAEASTSPAYGDSFSVGDDGVLLLREQVLEPGSCDPSLEYCPAEAAEIVWFAELRPWGDLAEEGAVRPIGVIQPVDANYRLWVTLSGEHEGSVAVVTSPNKPFGWQFDILTVPSLETSPCCPGFDLSSMTGTFTPTRGGILFLDNGVGRTVAGETEAAEPRLVLLAGETTQVIAESDLNVMFGNAVAWTDGFIAFSWSPPSHPWERLRILETDTGLTIDPPDVFEWVSSLDWQD